MSHIVVTGSENGLGAALVRSLRLYGHIVYEYDIVHGCDVLAPDLDKMPVIDVLINNAGINEINWLEDVSEDQWDRVMGVNAKGIYMMTRAALPKLIQSCGTVVNVVSNAAHMPMTCSLAYNASKGAAHIMTQQLARELTRKHGITVFGIAPNKMAGTGMSHSIDTQVMATRGWTLEQTQAYQLKGLLSGAETPPSQVAKFVAYLLADKEHHRYLTGCVIPYGI